MDPDEALKKLREALSKPISGIEDLYRHSDARQAFDALDGWLKSGGFPPKEWQRAG